MRGGQDRFGHPVFQIPEIGPPSEPLPPCRAKRSPPEGSSPDGHPQSPRHRSGSCTGGSSAGAPSAIRRGDRRLATTGHPKTAERKRAPAQATQVKARNEKTSRLSSSREPGFLQGRLWGAPAHLSPSVTAQLVDAQEGQADAVKDASCGHGRCPLKERGKSEKLRGWGTPGDKF